MKKALFTVLMIIGLSIFAPHIYADDTSGSKKCN